jgi:ABC-type branched-subunit amino acid transport system ATPase component
VTLHRGEIVGVIGANGAGKTTLFDIICGFLAPDAGAIRLNGRDITRAAPYERFGFGLGRSFQDGRLTPSLTVRETIAVAFERHIEVREPVASALAAPALIRSERRLAEHVEAMIARYSLERFADKFVSELSTGTRRVVELAAICAHRPSVVILDEPSSGLAQREAEAMVPLLLGLREELNATIAIIEHDIPMIRDLSDRLMCMHLGGVLAVGDPGDVLGNAEVIASYLGIESVAVNRSGKNPVRAGR